MFLLLLLMMLVALLLVVLEFCWSVELVSLLLCCLHWKFWCNFLSAHFGKLQFWSAMLKCSSSWCKECWSLETTLALCARVLYTPCLAVIKRLLFHCRNWSVWVGFLYTAVVSLLLSPDVTLVSKKGRDLCWSGSSGCELYVGVLWADVM